MINQPLIYDLWFMIYDLWFMVIRLSEWLGSSGL